MKTSIGVLVAIAAATAPVRAQTATTPPSTEPAVAIAAEVASAEQSAAAGPIASSADCCRIPAGTPIELEIGEPLSSVAHKRGDRFLLKLHAPVIHAGTTVIAAGTGGVGEIVHADAARGGGKPGELLLAARYLQHGATQVPLRALKFGGQGKDKTNVALGVGMAVGPFAHFVRGRNIEIPAGTVVNAKLAQDVVLPPAPAPIAAPDTAAVAPESATAPAPTPTHQE